MNAPFDGADTRTPLQLLDLAVATAREAADLVARGRATAAEHVDVKSSPVDVVTAVDTASEELIVGRLLAARPDDGVLGEEGAAAGRAPAVCAGSSTRSTAPSTSSTTCRPTRCRSPRRSTGRWSRASCSTSPRGSSSPPRPGAARTCRRRTGRPVPLTGSRPASLEQTLVATGFGYRVEQRRAQGAVVAALLPRVRDIRRYGSSALDLCAAAAGRIDAYYELDLNPWDHAAGALVAAEAGLVVTGLPGSPFGEPMAIAAAASIAGAVRRPARRAPRDLTGPVQARPPPPLAGRGGTLQEDLSRRRPRPSGARGPPRPRRRWPAW